MRLPILPACCLPLALCLAALSACNYRDLSGEKPDQPAASAGAPEGADSMASNDEAPSARPADSEARPVMQAQVVLDRLGFSVGVVDGKQGRSLANAVAAFQASRALPVTGELDAATRQALAQWSAIPATRVVTIPGDWGTIAFAPLPATPAEQAKLSQLGYTSMAEKLAERFHTTPAVLAALNPGGKPAGPAAPAAPETVPAATPLPTPSPAPAAPPFRAGQAIRVPNVGADAIDPAEASKPEWRATLRALGVGTAQPEAARLEVSEAGGWLHAYDAADRLIAAFTVSTGSRHDPLPIGDWKVKGVARNPTYVYNPELFWDADDSEAKQHLPPGPNGGRWGWCGSTSPRSTTASTARPNRR